MSTRTSIGRYAVTGTLGEGGMGVEPMFARQVQALGRKGDLAIGISTSGRSEERRVGKEC